MMTQRVMDFQNAKQVAYFIKSEYAKLDRPLFFQPNFKNPDGQHMRLIDQENRKIFHVKFARERFHKFSIMYPSSGSGEGESISNEVIKDLKDNDLIFFGNPQEILTVFVGDLKEMGVLRNNDRSRDRTWSIGLEFCTPFPD